ncbi:MAG TPA: ABC transporter permease subunit [Verrucomicrobiae bacterium]|jgi:ABC-type transport system involved in multi-copper enzyme maturation permease subunit|nr:ABC transporter permease subunit [Verrucomicrobiae bacterium]
MTFLPIVERELKTAARCPGLYWLRFASALLAAGLCAWVIAASSDTPRLAGPTSFHALAILAFLYTGIMGVQATCDCLAEEKREGTLGLLFLTDLKGYDVTLGKLAANSVASVYGLVAVIPALAIPLLLGGVNSGEVWRVTVVALNLLFFFLCIGLLASALCRHEQWALAVAVMIALAFTIGAPLVVHILRVKGFVSDEDQWMMLTPVSACVTAFRGRPYFWPTFALTQFYAWSFLGLACFITPRSWQERDAEAGNWRTRLAGSLEKKVRLRRELLAINPYLWRCGRDEFQRALVWIVLALCVAGSLAAAKVTGIDSGDVGAPIALGFLLSFLLKGWIALAAARVLTEDRRSGALELLLSTPLTEEAIIQGQRLALWRQFAFPIGATAGMQLLVGWVFNFHSFSPDRAKIMALYLILAVMLVLDALALSWWSMWAGFALRKANRAALVSLALVLGAPTAIFVLGCTAYSIFAPQAESGWATLWWWGGLGAAADLLLINRARVNLLRQFRGLAQNRHARPAQAAPTP